MVLVTVRVFISTRLTLASPEFNTTASVGSAGLAACAAPNAIKAAKKTTAGLKAS
jgi:hypothetical protein